MKSTVQVTIWNEFLHERSDDEVAKIYPHGIHAVLAAALRHADSGLTVQTATLDEPEHGLGEEVLIGEAARNSSTPWGSQCHASDIGRSVVTVYQQSSGLGPWRCTFRRRAY